LTSLLIAVLIIIESREEGGIKMENREFKSWWDLDNEERLAFAKKVVREKVLGWEELKQAAYGSGFEPDEDMPTIYELTHKAQETSC